MLMLMALVPDAETNETFHLSTEASTLIYFFGYAVLGIFADAPKFSNGDKVKAPAVLGRSHTRNLRLCTT